MRTTLASSHPESCARIPRKSPKQAPARCHRSTGAVSTRSVTLMQSENASRLTRRQDRPKNPLKCLSKLILDRRGPVISIGPAQCRRSRERSTLLTERSIQVLEQLLAGQLNDDYAKQNKSYALTTMRGPHVKVEGAELRFHFTGKAARLGGSRSMI